MSEEGEVQTLRETGVEVGDQVRLIQGGDYYRLNSTYRINLSTEDLFTVTRVFTDSVNVRTVEEIRLPHGRGFGRASFSFTKWGLTRVHGDDPDRPKVRRLGETPEGKIGIDHPDIQWLWEDLAEYAEGSSYCGEYDKIVARIGIPGRERNFTAKITVGDLEFTSTVKARSQKEANEKAQRALAGGEKVGQ